MAGKVMGLIFADRNDYMLKELTGHRTTASVPFGGRYRLIDFVLSSMVNSDIDEIAVVTKRNYQSLWNHVGAGRDWDLARKRGGLILITPFSSSRVGVYHGRLDAIASAANYIQHSDADYILLSDSDSVANLDFTDMIEQHIESQADISVMFRKTECEFARANGDYISISYDPQTMDVTDMQVAPDTCGTQNIYMEVTLINKVLLQRLVDEAVSRGRYSLIDDALQPAIGRMKIKAYENTAPVFRISSIRSFFVANMRLLEPQVRAALFPESRPVFTKVRDQVPVKYGLSSNVRNSLVADGCIIEGEVENCVISRSVRIGKGAVLKNCVIMQDVVVGAHAHLEYVIMDKDVRIMDNRILIGCESYPTYYPKGSHV